MVSDTRAVTQCSSGAGLARLAQPNSLLVLAIAKHLLAKCSLPSSYNYLSVSVCVCVSVCVPDCVCKSVHDCVWLRKALVSSDPLF